MPAASYMCKGLKVAGFIEEHNDHSVCYVIPTFTADGTLP